ncbi:SGNH hydrolase [Tothia fuscella]|uniref:SGNH hydrolase n=1 Tax=Tothia fuscella TaxID=1048955 RepID=A0A9P4NIX3_9PEZI|nr:SGNH hydrolase [Tothia fuscella]
MSPRTMEASKTKNELPKVILFGASLTAWSFDTSHGKGFGDVLAKHYGGRAEVVNEGQPGGTSNTMAGDFIRIVSSLSETTIPPLLITIFLGANDACLFPPQVHVPLEKYSSNLRSFVDDVLNSPYAPTTKILLITPPPINISAAHAQKKATYLNREDEDFEQKWEADCRDNYAWKTWASKKKYADEVVKISHDYAEAGMGDRVAVFDLWRVMINHELREAALPTLKEGRVNLEENGRWPGCGLPHAKGFAKGVFSDGLHFGEKVSSCPPFQTFLYRSSTLTA